MGGNRRATDLVVAGVEPSVAEVLGDGPAKEDRILQHECDPLAKRAQAVLANVSAIDAHTTGEWLVESRNQADRRRLAGAGEPDERNHLARMCLEAYLL